MNKHPSYCNRWWHSSPRSRRCFTLLVLSLLCATLAMALLPGCATGSAGGLVRALGADTNAVQVNVTSPWGTLEVRRNLPARQ